MVLAGTTDMFPPGTSGQRIEMNENGKRIREIVIEIERIRLVRKRAKTTLQLCNECETPSDFVGLAEAGRLFEIGNDDLMNFIEKNGCHFMKNGSNDTQICLTALLDRMRAIDTGRKLECNPLRLQENKK